MRCWGALGWVHPEPPVVTELGLTALCESRKRESESLGDVIGIG